MNMLVRRWSVLCVVACSFQFFCVSQAAAQEEDPDLKILAEYRLTDEGLDNFMQASRNLFAALKADPSLDDKMDAPDDASIADMSAMYDSEPSVREAIESADMTTEEYVTFMYSMMQAGMAAWLVEQYGQEELPEGTPQENVDYYLANKDKITAMTEEMQKMEETTAEE